MNDLYTNHSCLGKELLYRTGTLLLD